MSKRRKTVPAVPPLPVDYQSGALPSLPAREETVHVFIEEELNLKGAQPTTCPVTFVGGQRYQIDFTDQPVLQMLLHGTRMRDNEVDRAFSEILAAIEEKPLTGDLLHSVRMRLRKLGDDVYCLTRVNMAMVIQRERVKQRCEVDPTDIVKAVRKKVASGMTTTDAMHEVAAETDRAFETIRNAYYKHRQRVPK